MRPLAPPLGRLFFSDAPRSEKGSVTFMKVQMLEVYNEKLKDLLLPHGHDKEKPPGLGPVGR